MGVKMDRRVEVGCLYDYYGACLTPRQRSFIEQYINEDLSLGEISEQEGISRQGVRDSIRRSVDILFGLENKLGMLRRARTTLKGVDELETMIRAGIEKGALLEKLSSIRQAWEDTNGI